MEFETHLFISYAHLDNVAISDEQKGWVTRFHSSLSALLSMRLGRQAVIWRDEKLAGNDIFGDEILDQFPKAAVLVCILSPRYLGSDWCARELREFCEAAERTVGLVVGNKSRVVKLIKSPYKRDDPLPEIMKTVLGYQFFEYAADGVPIELDPIFGPEIAQKYRFQVAKLAWELALALERIGEAGSLAPAVSLAAAQKTPTVYLAECTFDQREARDALEVELKCHGYRVLPEHALSRDEATYGAEVARLLQECLLSIHIIGNSYGPVPDGPAEKSIVVLQNELATRCSRQHGLHRLIWLPDAIKPTQDLQKAFILHLQRDAEAQYGADLVTSNDREIIKNAIHSALARIQAPPSLTSYGGIDSSDKLIYLICDQRDRQSTLPLRRFLRSQGFQVKLPVFEGDAAGLRQANEALLQDCNAVILFYGEGGEAWKRSVESEVKKNRGRSASKILPWTFITSPETDAKLDLIDLDEPQILNCLSGFSEIAVLPFVQGFREIHR